MRLACGEGLDMRVLMSCAVALGIAVGGIGAANEVRAAGAPAKVVKADLSGHWVLNEKLSDKMGPPGGGMRGGMGGGPGGGMGGGPGGGMRGGPPPDGAEGGPPAGGPQGQQGPRARMLRDMVVEQSSDEILLSERGKVDRLLVFRSGELPRITDEGVPQSKAAWDHGKVVIDETTPRGRVLETWELSKGGQQLVITTRVQRGEDAFDRKRVYDRVGE